MIFILKLLIILLLLMLAKTQNICGLANFISEC